MLEIKYVGDKLEILVTMWFNIEESHQYNDLVNKIFQLSPSYIRQHNIVTDITVRWTLQRIDNWFLYGNDNINADIIVKIGYDR